MLRNAELDIAVVGSPSTNTELTLDLLQEATEERLIGALVGFRSVQNAAQLISLGQVVSIELRNRWHEDSVFRNLIKRTGTIPPITNRQDTRTAELTIGASFETSALGYDPSMLGSVPPTGTRVFRVDQPLLDSVLSQYQEELFYLGHAYSTDLLYPMWFKHFDSGLRGAGEAYHTGIFGRTGSGKSALAKMLLCAYARHASLGILIIDPQGEFADELSGQRRGQQGLALDEIVRGTGREIEVYRLNNLQLDDWATFRELVVALSFHRVVGMPSASVEQVESFAELMETGLRSASVTLTAMGSEQNLRVALQHVAQNSQRVYATPQRAARLAEEIGVVLETPSRMTEALERWRRVTTLFDSGPGKSKIFTRGNDETGIVNRLLRHAPGASRPLITIDISEAGNHGLINESLQQRILQKLLSTLVNYGVGLLSPNESANVLVVLDEAHRHAPSGSLDSSTAAELRSLLIRSVRETRKYGIGWTFISQTLGGLHQELLFQLRILFFGFGLAMGSELERLKQFVGGDSRAIELYQSFRDPQSFPRRDLQEFPFMAVGPISPLAFSGRPIFFTAFTDPAEFARRNELI